MFTYITEHFVQLGGVHDEVRISHHVVYGVCLLETKFVIVKNAFPQQVAVLHS